MHLSEFYSYVCNCKQSLLILTGELLAFCQTLRIIPTNSALVGAVTFLERLLWPMRSCCMLFDIPCCNNVASIINLFAEGLCCKYWTPHDRNLYLIGRLWAAGLPQFSAGRHLAGAKRNTLEGSILLAAINSNSFFSEHPIERKFRLPKLSNLQKVFFFKSSPFKLP
jgi:hypothetical protein